jgi:RNA polymerase sigma-70 factor (ECF subfamily)
MGMQNPAARADCPVDRSIRLVASATLAAPLRQSQNLAEKPAPGLWTDSEPVHKDSLTEYMPLVRRLLRRSFGNDPEVEDLVNDVFISLLESAPRIRSRDAVGSYVIAVTMNATRREIRKRIRRRRVAPVVADDAVEPSAPHDVEASAAVLRLEAVLGELSSSERAAFTARWIQGMRIAEVAAVLNTSIATTKRRIHAATCKLTKRLGRDVLLSPYVSAPS